MAEIQNYGLGLFFERLCRGIIKYKWLVLILILAVTFFMVTQMKHLVFDNSKEIWFVKGDKAITLLDKFHHHFGNDEFVFILLEPEELFKRETLSLAFELAEELEGRVPYLRDITWLGNVEHMETEGSTIRINDFIEILPDSPEQMGLLREKAMADTDYTYNFISEDALAAGMVLNMENYPGDKMGEAESEIATAVKEVVANARYASLNLKSLGGPLLNHEYSTLASKETGLFLCVGLLFQVLILYWAARRFRGVFVPVAVVCLSVIWTMGTIGLIGFKINMLIGMIPTLLICVGIGDSIHFISEYRARCVGGSSRIEAMARTFSLVGPATLFTTVTTAAAFLAFLTLHVKAYNELGVYAAIGVFAAFVLTIALVPAIFLIGGKKSSKKKARHSERKDSDIISRILLRIYDVASGYPRLIVSFFLVLTLISLAGTAQLKVESNTAKMLKPGVPIRIAYDRVDEKMGGSMSLEIMLDTGKKDGVKSLAFLKKMDQLQTFLDNHPKTTRTDSVLNVIRKIHYHVHGEEPGPGILPGSDRSVSEYLFLYETGGGDELDKMVGFEYDTARITVKMKVLDTANVRAFIQDVEAFVEPLFTTGTVVETTGALTWVKSLNDKINVGLRDSMIAAFVAIALVMTLLFRSIWLGMISMIPNLFPVVVSLGALGLSGSYMDMAIMSSSAVILGVSVDDTIHFFMRFKTEFNKHKNYNQALRATLLSVGRALTLTTLILTAGFIVMVLSSVTGMIKFGLLAPFAFIWALIADLLLVPAMIILIKPLGKEEEKEKKWPE